MDKSKVKEENCQKGQLKALIVGQIITFFGFIIGCHNLETQINEQRRLEFDKFLWQKRYELYSSLSTEINNLIEYCYADKGKFDIARANFMQLYWGTLTLIEDTSVNELLIDFKDVVDEIYEGAIFEIDDLRIAAENLAIACKNSLNDTSN